MIRFINAGKEHCDYIKKAKIRYTYYDMDELWNDLAVLFEEKKVRYIPVFRRDDKLLGLAYMKYWKRENYIAYLDKTLGAYKDLSFNKFFKEYWKGFEVHIYGFNECGWILYKIFERYQISVKGVGEGWRKFYPKAIQGYANNEMSSKRIWSIDVEGKNQENPPDNVLLQSVEAAYNTTIVSKWRCNLEGYGILFQCILIPRMEGLQYITSSEQYRFENEISPYMSREKWEDREVRRNLPQNDIFCKWEDWQEIDKKKIRKEVEIDGQRVYYGEYGEGIRKVYLIGPCIVRGMCVSDEDSLGRYIFETFKQRSEEVKVICLSPSTGSLVSQRGLLQKLLMRKGDVVFYINVNVCKIVEDMGYRYEKNINLSKLFNARKTDYFWDCPIHTNAIGNRYIAETCVKEVLDKFKDYFKTDPVNNHLVQTGEVMLAPEAEKEIEKFLEGIKKSLPEIIKGRVGAIVMNCNPMTNGHRYLIQQALRTVDFLYVFVVEEDKSEITFSDRIEMVKRVTCNMDNVFVFPSGRFMISYMTMPIYFEKESRQSDIWDASYDIQLFCERIAPALEITVRFMGEELSDRVTRQYNDTLRELAPLYGISFVEIPRVGINGEVISATKVRKYLKEGRFDLVQVFTPKENWEILRKYLK